MDQNVVAFTGRLGRDPESKTVSGDRKVADFPLAVQVGADSVMWIDVSCWGPQAVNAEKYLSKGSKVAVDGYMRQDRWETEDGQKRSKLRMTANRVIFLDTKGESSSEYSGAASVKPDGGSNEPDELDLSDLDDIDLDDFI